MSENLNTIKVINFASTKVAEPIRREKDSYLVVYTAPEIFLSPDYSEATDVFSFAMCKRWIDLLITSSSLFFFFQVMWNVIARSDPFPGKKSVSECLIKGDRPSIPSHCPKELAKLISWAWYNIIVTLDLLRY